MEGYLKLENGEGFTGQWHGETYICSGELIFYTGMGNFLEFMTDPAVKGKIALFSYPGILNSCFDKEKFESENVQLAGIITQQDWIPTSQSNENLMSLFLENKIPVMTGMDTRTIMKSLLEVGEMPVQMLANNKAQSNIHETNLAFAHPVKRIVNPKGEKHLVVIDFGLKNSLVKWLNHNNYRLTIVPAQISAETIRSLEPDGLVFSGGPGNPVKWKNYFKEYSEVAKNYPTIGFGLGHQILGLAFGANVEKMKGGHRCFKQPVIHTTTKLVFMSNQNHGYAISEDGLAESGFFPSFTSIQDGTIDGLIHQDYPIATYQFHPNGKNAELESVIIDSFSLQMKQYKGETIYA